MPLPLRSTRPIRTATYSPPAALKYAATVAPLTLPTLRSSATTSFPPAAALRSATTAASAACADLAAETSVAAAGEGSSGLVPLLDFPAS